jgi:uncharacterized protein YcbX
MTHANALRPMMIQSLWRYPVKSMQGEVCLELDMEANGVAGDRSWGVLDLTSNTVISAKRDGRLLEASASLRDGEILVRLPGAQEIEPGDVLDENLTRWLGRPVKLVEAVSHGVATFEAQGDFERDDSDVEQWEGTSASFVDESPLHVLTTGDLEFLSSERPDLHWDVRRFRPNIVVVADHGALGPVEVGRRIQLGDVEIEVWKGCTRCVMTTRSQPDGLDRELDILRHSIKFHDNTVGLRAWVVGTGRVRVGDPVLSVV